MRANQPTGKQKPDMTLALARLTANLRQTAQLVQEPLLQMLQDSRMDLQKTLEN